MNFFILLQCVYSNSNWFRTYIMCITLSTSTSLPRPQIPLPYTVWTNSSLRYSAKRKWTDMALKKNYIYPLERSPNHLLFSGCWKTLIETLQEGNEEKQWADVYHRNGQAWLVLGNRCLCEFLFTHHKFQSN